MGCAFGSQPLKSPTRLTDFALDDAKKKLIGLELYFAEYFVVFGFSNVAFIIVSVQFRFEGSAFGFVFELAKSCCSFHPPPRALMSCTDAARRWPASWARVRSDWRASRFASTTSR